MAGVFITSTGTETGKTFIASALLHQMFKAGREVRAIKPIASGLNQPTPSDPVRLLRAMGMPQHPSAIQQICPWSYAEPIAPHIAARRSGKPIIWRELKDYCYQAMQAPGTTIIEGAGGLMCPTDNEHTMLDLVVALNIPVVLVVSNYLGAISHSLTAMKVLETNRVMLVGIVICEAEQPTVEKDEMIRILKQASYMEQPIIWVARTHGDADSYKHITSLEAMWNKFPNG